MRFCYIKVLCYIHAVYFSISLAKNIVPYTEDFLTLYKCLGVYTISLDDPNSLTSPIYY